MDPLTEGKVDDYGSLQTDHNATAIEVLKLEQDTCAKDVKEDQKDDIKRNAQEIMNKDPEIFEEGKTMEMSFKEKIWRTALADAAYLGVVSMCVFLRVKDSFVENVPITKFDNFLSLCCSRHCRKWIAKF